MSRYPACFSSTAVPSPPKPAPMMVIEGWCMGRTLVAVRTDPVAVSDARIGHRGEELTALLGVLVLDQHLVARGHHLGHRGEVAPSTRGGVAGERPDQAEDGTEDHRGQDDRDGAAAVAEQRDDQADEQAHPDAREQASGGDLAVGEPARDALDLLEVGSDDQAVLDRELVVGQEVHRLLRLLVLLVDAQGEGELEGECRGGDPEALRLAHGPSVANPWKELSSLRAVLVVACVLAALAALVHVYIFVLESLRWTDPATRRVFGT